MNPEIAIVVSPREWAEALHRFVADHGGARVRARVLDAREALDEGYRVLIAEDLTSFLTPRLVAELHRRGRRVLGVYDPVEPWGRERLRELGVDDTIESTATPDAVLSAVGALAISAGADLDAELVGLDGADAGASRPSAEPRREPGRPVIAVAGPTGGPGATETAIGLADALCRAGHEVVLVDADDVAPAVAQRLGLPLHPNLRTAIDVVEHWTGQLADTLSPSRAGGFPVLGGLANPRDRAQLRAGEVVDVLDELSRHHGTVVVDVGDLLDELGGHGAASGSSVTRSVLGRAEVVVGVAAPTPVGLARLLDWVADVRAVTTAPLSVAINRAPTSPFRRGELTQELTRTFEPASLTFLPEDKRVAQAAWNGELVAGGPFTRALDRLAREVLDRIPVGVLP